MAVPFGHPRATMLVTFLPHRLNRQPVVVRGLTADELWITANLSAAAGFALGVPLILLTHSIAMVSDADRRRHRRLASSLAAASCARRSADQPDTWLYRELQWRLALAIPRHPALAAAHHPLGLVDHAAPSSRPPATGCWTTRRSDRSSGEPFRTGYAPAGP